MLLSDSTKTTLWSEVRIKITTVLKAVSAMAETFLCWLVTTSGRSRSLLRPLSKAKTTWKQPGYFWFGKKDHFIRDSNAVVEAVPEEQKRLKRWIY